MPGRATLLTLAALGLLLMAGIAWQTGLFSAPSDAVEGRGLDTASSRQSARADTDGPRNHAVILMYHRFGEDRYPATSIRVEQFEEHLAYLQDNGFTVLPLTTVIESFETGEPLPARSVAITVDDAYRSALTVARPMLAAADMPWTLFVTTDQPDRQLGDFMSWDDIRDLEADPMVTIGHHSGAHHHMPDHDAATNRHDIARANDRFEAELGHVPELFAFPFGEYSDAVLEVIREFDFRAAFGQHSGVAHSQEARLELPRFAMNENWGRMDRFMERIDTKPLPVTDIRPSDSLVVADNPPRLSFTLTDSGVQASQVGCFPSGGVEATIERDGRRVTVVPQTAFQPGRARINCTAPFGDGSFRWFGRQFVVRDPGPDGHVPHSDPGAGVPASP
ncbi:MAG: polysaccharide deacetylase family protein [Gammaproteobacteria bacterium]|nr:polysaccharide deacetylase family protein [Gammaproteobacteria bacterium]